MSAITLLLEQVAMVVYLVLFATFSLAALQNVTVDDSVTTGPVVPQYFPSGDWNQGNECMSCAANLDPTKVYNGTWHDATSSQSSFKYFEVSFVGSALYIYFILTNDNNILLEGGITSVNFTLDGVTYPQFLHTPTPGAGYQYNAPIFAVDSLPSSTHSMTIQPFIPTYANSSLMLFDYLVYTTDEENVTTTTTVPHSAGSATTIITSLGSVVTITSSSIMTTTSSKSSTPNIRAVVGGTVAGVGVVALVAVFLLCYWRHKRRAGGQPRAAEATRIVEPFIATQMAPTPASLPIHQTQAGIPQFQFGLGSKRRPNPSPGTVPTPDMPAPPSSDTPNGSRLSSSSNNVTSDLIQEIGLLRGELARLREHRSEEQNLIETRSEAPPDYFTS